MFACASNMICHVCCDLVFLFPKKCQDPLAEFVLVRELRAMLNGIGFHLRVVVRGQYGGSPNSIEFHTFATSCLIRSLLSYLGVFVPRLHTTSAPPHIQDPTLANPPLSPASNPQHSSCNLSKTLSDLLHPDSDYAFVVQESSNRTRSLSTCRDCLSNTRAELPYLYCHALTQEA